MIGASHLSVQDIIVVIGAATSAVVTIIGAIFAGMAAFRITGVSHKVAEVHDEVKTLNAKTIGVLAGEMETRRIVEKPPEDRTFADQQHLHDVPPEPSTGEHPVTRSPG